jgi:hypothetical protein
VPTVLLSAIGSGRNALRALHGKTNFMQESTYMTGMMMDSELFLQDPSNHGRSPHSRIQTVGHRTTVQDVAQLLPSLTGQLGWSSRALPLQQSVKAMLLIARQPFGYFRTRGLQNFEGASNIGPPVCWCNNCIAVDEC